MADYAVDFDEIVKDIKKYIGAGLERGLNAAAEHYVRALKSSFQYHGPRRKSGGKRYMDSLYIDRRFRQTRYVGSTKTVKGAKSDTIPLSNILEYGRHDGTGANPILRQTFDRMQDELADDVIREIEF